MKKLIVICVIAVILAAKSHGDEQGNEPREFFINSSDSSLVKKFLNEFIIHNQRMKYPVKVDEMTTLLGQESTEIRGRLYLVQNLKLSIVKSNLNVSIKELENIMRNELKAELCSSLAQREYIFKGFSEVGIIHKYYDQNNEYIGSVSVDKNYC